MDLSSVMNDPPLVPRGDAAARSSDPEPMITRGRTCTRTARSGCKPSKQQSHPSQHPSESSELAVRAKDPSPLSAQHLAASSRTSDRDLSTANPAASHEETQKMEYPNSAALQKRKVQQLFDRGVPFFTKLTLEFFQAQIKAIKDMAENGESTEGQKFVFLSVTGAKVERAVIEGLTRWRRFGNKTGRLEPCILYTPYQALVHNRFSDQALCALQICYRHQVEPQQQRSVNDIRNVFQTYRHAWEAHESCSRVKACLNAHVRCPVSKIIAFACGSFSGADDERRRRSATQHALILTLRDMFQERFPAQTTACLAQDPAYTEVDKIVLSELGIEVVDDPEGFLEVDDTSVVVSFCPNVPVRQIITDMARPAVLAWDTVTDEEHTMTRWAKGRAMEPAKAKVSAEELEACETDPPSSRVRAMIQEEYLQIDGLNVELFGESSIYVRREML